MPMGARRHIIGLSTDDGRLRLTRKVRIKDHIK